MTDVARRSHPGRDHGSPALGAATLFLSLLPAAAQAGAWADFEARCLSALQDFAAPVVARLGPGTAGGGVTRYALDGDRALRVETAPAGGRIACAVRDPSGDAVPGFDAWVAEAVAAGRYVPVADGRWRSKGWIEPVLEVQETRTDAGLTLRILETNLEA
ncbi:hypothetical protein [Roseovarius ramblicola]|uniref:Uncharacterized protein n=1 Tax=Roseovarius ramblicola TaxID=2022336 RepID=A0ABV5HX34_9RHOB